MGHANMLSLDSCPELAERCNPAACGIRDPVTARKWLPKTYARAMILRA